MDMSLHTRNAIPNWAIALFAGIALASIISIGVYRALGYGPVGPAQLAVIESEVHLFFEDQADGTVRVLDAGTGDTIEVLAYGEDGFIRSTMRGLARARKQHGHGPEKPFRLALHRDGHLTLKDPVTKQVIHLRAYGPTNEQAFGRLLAAGPSATGELAASDAAGTATTAAASQANTDQG